MIGLEDLEGVAATVSLACPACGKGVRSDVLSEGAFEYRAEGAARVWRYRLLRCPECGLGRLDPAPDEEALAALYPSDYGAYHAPQESARARRLKMWIAGLTASAERKASPRALRWLADRLARTAETLGARSVPLTTWYPLSLPHGARILDFGCGSGWWLQVLARAGYSNLCAYDIDHPGLLELERRGMEVIRDDVGNLPSEHFDCIRLEHVLEHFVDPLGLLKSLRRCLRPRGTIVLTVPNFASWSAGALGDDWPALCLPYHVSHFTERALRSISAAAGLGVERVQFLPIWEAARPAMGRTARDPDRGPSDGMVRRRLPGHLRKILYHRWAVRAGAGDYVGVRLRV